MNLLKKIRQTTVFERLLLLIGVAVIIIGFLLLKAAWEADRDIGWMFIQSLFLWFILIFIVILTDSNESIKEELGIIIKEHIEETKLMKEEITLLREDLKLQSLNMKTKK